MENWLVSYRKEWLRPDVIAGLDHRCGGHSQGHGVCDNRRSAGAGGAIHGLPADGDLRRAGHLTGTQREHDYDARDSDCRGTGRGGSKRRSRCIVDCHRHADPAGWGDARACCRAAPGLRGQLHLRAGLDWLQGGHRSRHRAGPDPENSRDPLCQRHVRPESAFDSPRHSQDVAGDTCRRSLHDRLAGCDGAFHAQGASSADRSGGRHRWRLLPELACAWS